MNRKLLALGLLCAGGQLFALPTQAGFAGSGGNVSRSGDLDYICADESVDIGFVVASKIKDSELASTCPGGEVLGIKRVSLLGSIDVCVGSTIPSGWVITWISPGSPYCAGQSRLRITDTAGLAKISACYGTPVPNGWVITGLSANSSACAGGYAAFLANSAPPPPPPPPSIPQAPVIQTIAKNGSGHVVTWVPANDYPQYRLRFVLEQRIDAGGWRQVYKGWDNTSWTATNVPTGTYTYRVKRITPVADGQYSGAVSVTHGGF